MQTLCLSHFIIQELFFGVEMLTGNRVFPSFKRTDCVLDLLILDCIYV